ncbi:MAG: tetratricopeptide repeat protein [Methylococcales bacterium]|nr:tetratricopeptide repeat protein [Methylococcales bacterium]
MNDVSIPQAIQLALGYHQKGELEQAEAIYQQVLSIEANNSDVLYLLGLLAHQIARHDVAIELISRSIAINTNFADAHFNLGNAQLAMNQVDDAMLSYQQALSIKPNYPELLLNLGKIFHDKGLLDQAEHHYFQALQHKPNFLEALFNMGNLLKDQGKLDEAKYYFYKVIELHPDFATVYCNLGSILQQQRNDDEAMQFFNKALKLKPDDEQVYCNMGNIHSLHGRTDEALSCYQQCLAINPEFADAHYNQALSLLQIGDFLQGWKEYEWRWKSSSWQIDSRGYSQPQWQGESLVNKTILLYPEQGYGDAIQFIRYVKKVAEFGGQIIVECQTPLTQLFSCLPEIKASYSLGEAPLTFDVHAPLMSLPFILKTSLHDIPESKGYLSVQSEDIEQWQQQLELSSEGLNVGFIWCGNPGHCNDHNRSIPIDKISPLFEEKKIKFFSLQVTERSKELENIDTNICDLSSKINNFYDTATIIMNLEVVIAVDTAIAHLAGALGRPVWLMLPYHAEWRWLENRLDSPWYASMRLYRQQAEGDWVELIQRVKTDLKRMA